MESATFLWTGGRTLEVHVILVNRVRVGGGGGEGEEGVFG